MHPLIRIVTIALVSSALPTLADAGLSGRFRLTRVKATARCAQVQLSFLNDWGDAGRTRENQEVRLWLSNIKPEANIEFGSYVLGNVRSPQAQEYGAVKMIGRGALTIDVDYKRFGFAAGDTLWVTGCWVKSGHCWGEIWKTRESGSLVLPALKPQPLIHINQLSHSELLAVPGIGKVTATAVIKARQRQPLANGRQLRSLIGAARYNQLKGRLRY
ncbi:MAG: helix-hairpin-helix domain-containing protein [Deltaproteobacteria bacterium]|nr:helix-hairpin-helix domain-containing protein [Deltaproteobacteria bacterium]